MRFHECVDGIERTTLRLAVKVTREQWAALQSLSKWKGEGETPHQAAQSMCELALEGELSESGGQWWKGVEPPEEG